MVSSVHLWKDDECRLWLHTIEIIISGWLSTRSANRWHSWAKSASLRSCGAWIVRNGCIDCKHSGHSRWFLKRINPNQIFWSYDVVCIEMFSMATRFKKRLLNGNNPCVACGCACKSRNIDGDISAPNENWSADKSITLEQTATIFLKTKTNGRQTRWPQQRPKTGAFVPHVRDFHRVFEFENCWRKGIILPLKFPIISSYYSIPTYEEPCCLSPKTRGKKTLEKNKPYQGLNALKYSRAKLLSERRKYVTTIETSDPKQYQENYDLGGKLIYSLK